MVFFNFLLLLFHFILIFPLCAKSDKVLTPNCNTPNTTSTSFDSDLSRLFSSLTNNASQSGYSTYIVGQNGNTLYGAAMCQAGTTYTSCNTCLTTATSDIVELCAKKVNATLWYDNCILRYSNTNFFTSLDAYNHCMPGVTDVQQDLKDSLNNLVSKTMLNLSSNAAYNSSQKYAVREVDFTSSVPLYELVQCTRNLSNDECHRCLSDLVGLLMIENCSSGKLGGRVLAQSCYVRFETVEFFDSSLISSSGATPFPSVTNTTDPEPMTPTITSKVLLTNEGLSHGMGDHEISIIPSSIRTDELVQYSLETLQIVTENFSKRKKLGGGRFGEVFEGMIDGVQVAIKKLREDSVPLSRLLDLGKEVTLLAPLYHRNLVKLLGFCIEAGHYVLVYEFIDNKDLGKHLKDDSLRQTLDWETRRRIIKGIADGLRYLHSESRNKKRIIHCDLKAENVLLDDKNVVKIADFGLSRILRADKTYESSRVTVGTPGYIAPELWPPKPIYSPQADVYSFGVLLLEIMTKWTVSAYEGVLTHDVWDHWKSNALIEIIDPSIADECPEEEALWFMLIGLSCVQGDRRKRPDMKNVVEMLRGEAPLPEPSYPGYYPEERQPQKKNCWFSRIMK
ncbi:cysteine-rich receptor-like protein kinase 10 isoform X3 [Carex rostrata]